MNPNSVFVLDRGTSFKIVFPNSKSIRSLFKYLKGVSSGVDMYVSKDMIIFATDYNGTTTETIIQTQFLLYFDLIYSDVILSRIASDNLDSNVYIHSVISADDVYSSLINTSKTSNLTLEKIRKQSGIMIEVENTGNSSIINTNNSSASTSLFEESMNSELFTHVVTLKLNQIISAIRSVCNKQQDGNIKILCGDRCIRLISSKGKIQSMSTLGYNNNIEDESVKLTFTNSRVKSLSSLNGVNDLGVVCICTYIASLSNPSILLTVSVADIGQCKIKIVSNDSI